MRAPLLVEIIAYAPTAYYHCTHCEIAWREFGMSNHIHEEQVGSSLPEDLAGQFQMVSAWVRQLFQKHNNWVEVKVIDAASFEGFVKSLRYNTRRFPAVIVDRKAAFSSGTMQEAEQTIDRILDALQIELT